MNKKIIPITLNFILPTVVSNFKLLEWIVKNKCDPLLGNWACMFIISIFALTCLWCNTKIIKNLVKSLEHGISISTSKRLLPHCISRAIVSYCILKRSSVRPSFLTRIFFGIPHFTLVDLISLETWNLEIYIFVTNVKSFV